MVTGMYGRSGGSGYETGQVVIGVNPDGTVEYGWPTEETPGIIEGADESTWGGSYVDQVSGSLDLNGDGDDVAAAGDIGKPKYADSVKTVHEGIEYWVTTDPDTGYETWDEIGPVYVAPPPDPLTIDDSLWGSLEDAINSWNQTISTTLGGLDYDYTAQQNKLNELTGKINTLERPDLTDTYSNMDSLISRIEGGPTTEDEQAALDYAAMMQGFESGEEYTAFLESARNATRSDMQGLTDEEKSEYDRLARSNMADQERREQAQLEAVFANTGSAIQFMTAADESNSRMINTRAQYDMEQLNQNVALQMQELTRLDDQARQALEAGNVSANQYLTMRTDGLYRAFEGYASKAALMMQEYETDASVISQQIDSVYNAIVAQTGIDQGIISSLTAAYSTAMAPYNDALNAFLSKENLDAQDQALAIQSLSAVGDVLAGIGSWMPW